MPKISLTDVASGYNRGSINDNFASIEDELNNKVLYRNNPEGEPNQMESDIDMNSNKITNLPPPENPTDAVNKEYVDSGVVAEVTQLAFEAAGSADSASQSETLSANAAMQADSSAADSLQNYNSSLAVLAEFKDIYLGAFASNPTQATSGTPLSKGMLYYNTQTDTLNYFTGGLAWVPITDASDSVSVELVHFDQLPVILMDENTYIGVRASNILGGPTQEPSGSFVGMACSRSESSGTVEVSVTITSTTSGRMYRKVWRDVGPATFVEDWDEIITSSSLNSEIGEFINSPASAPFFNSGNLSLLSSATIGGTTYDVSDISSGALTTLSIGGVGSGADLEIGILDAIPSEATAILVNLKIKAVCSSSAARVRYGLTYATCSNHPSSTGRYNVMEVGGIGFGNGVTPEITASNAVFLPKNPDGLYYLVRVTGLNLSSSNNSLIATVAGYTVPYSVA